MPAFLSLADAIGRHVEDGMCVALEGFTHLIPFAAGHEIIRQGRKRLHLVRMTPDLIYDQMIGMGVADRLTFSWGGNPGVGSLHRLRDATERGWPNELAIFEHSHGEMAAAFAAGAAGLPHGLMKGPMDTDLPQHQEGRVASVVCPFTGQPLKAVRAVNPDVTILHAQKADRRGNVLIEGISGAVRDAAFAARAVLVTVEEIVDDLAAPMNALVLPHFVVTAISHVPGGAYPSYAQGCYGRDNSFYVGWDAVARERETFLAWMQEHCISKPDHRAHLESLGVLA
ncbi:MAG: CoA transferase subunit A [Alphaproteobacteria bacterium]|nr:MAG: CoA transferase subunit A [Alphaproteobacteria bacterium]